MIKEVEVLKKYVSFFKLEIMLNDFQLHHYIDRLNYEP
jgi:hypothetical protein